MLELLTTVSIGRTRLSPKASRAAALEAARRLLMEDGPQAVTLKSVATRIGKSHGTLLHHFGSAAGLQSALAAELAQDIAGRIAATVLAAKPGQADLGVIVDLAFDAFAHQGGGPLAAWMIMSGDTAALGPVFKVLHDLVERIGERDGQPVRERALALILLALGDALLGGLIAPALGLPREAVRRLAERLIAPHGLVDSTAAEASGAP